MFDRFVFEEFCLPNPVYTKWTNNGVQSIKYHTILFHWHFKGYFVWSNFLFVWLICFQTIYQITCLINRNSNNFVRSIKQFANQNCLIQRNSNNFVWSIGFQTIFSNWNNYLTQKPPQLFNLFVFLRRRRFCGCWVWLVNCH